MQKTQIIAEIGVNHNGNLKLAKKMIKSAAACGADIVKFQTFKPENLVKRSLSKAKYQKINTNKNENQFEMLKKLEIPEKFYPEILKECKKNKVEFLSSAFDIKSLKLLLSLKIKKIKIPSGEITNLPYLEYIKNVQLPIILSTGMSNIREIENAIKILQKENKKIILLHCNSEYPTPYDDVNLKAMVEMGKIFNLNYGYSDHTSGIEVPIAAVALGASVIEKHFTIDKSLPGPDQKSSLEPNDFKEMVIKIRNIEKSLGKKIKKATRSEIKNKIYVRKSIIAKKEIKIGEKFTKENLDTLRPGSGISPMKWYKIIGKKSNKNYKKNQLIKL